MSANLSYTSECSHIVDQLRDAFRERITRTSIKTGETVLTLGSGTGSDSLIAAIAVGPTGLVIGVDMSPEMVSKARRQAMKSGLRNVEFRLGQIEALPVDDLSCDVVTSNCVINSVKNKAKAFHEAYRVLRSGGRLAITDVVATRELPHSLRIDLDVIARCLTGAPLVTDLEKLLKKCGFVDIRVTPEEHCKHLIKEWAPDLRLQEYVLAANIVANKP